ncbi:hypothetical protein JR316_0001977 [Psilocybe cubensis]|uniref:Uncharacterized protein n=2 Tax=Psilocybe cubensis TaxID=181762 RepID=A0ACB8HB37_PSICU|nr:hypothetical protein JR316_0001977 [Psilocybe cubensis]KAH9485071.1 hypothetical protein JR316_0001977 [Psilocybe cubensis]
MTTVLRPRHAWEYALILDQPQRGYLEFFIGELIDAMEQLHMELDVSTNHVLYDTSPIARLPDELLELIFLHNTFKELKEDKTSLVHDPYRTTITTLLVCKRWYTVALSYPPLWSRIIDYRRHSPQWIAELLSRSKHSLIDVGQDSVFELVRLRDARGKTILKHIFDHASTLRTLSLEITFAPWEFICKEFLQYPAPELEYLNIITSCPFPDCLYPGPLFADCAPKLRRFHLQRCLVDFTSPMLCNLTELSVMDILSPFIGLMRKLDHPLKVAPTPGGWLSILQHIPSLKYLTLNNAISHPTDNEAMPDITLPNLLFLTVGAKFHDGTAFLHHLSIPTSCGIRLRFSHDKSSTSADAGRLLSFLSTQLSFWPDDTPERYLQAKILSGDRIHFGNSRRVGHIWDMTEADVIAEHAASTCDPLLWLVLSFDTSDDTLHFFNSLLSLYEPTYATTTTLDLWIDEEFMAAANDNNAAGNGSALTNLGPPFPSLDILHSFTSVRTLNLLERSPLYLLPHLQTASLPDHTLFPSLRSLRLTRTNFEGEQRTAYFTIIAFLIWRTQVHKPLGDLQIVESRMSRETEEAIARAGNVRVMKASGSSAFVRDGGDGLGGR